MDDYFLWPSIGNHRLRLQTAVQAWLLKHPNCCAAPRIVWAANAPKSRMSATELTRARTQFSQLRPGMGPAQVLKIAGKPDAIDSGSDPNRWHISLLGLCANEHNENLAYIYFTERWADEIARRDPLRDRYVIVFFSAEGKLTRMFSNIAAIRQSSHPPRRPGND